MGDRFSPLQHLAVFFRAGSMERVVADDSGQGLVEYGLLASLISIAAMGTLMVFGVSVSDFWSEIEFTLVGLLS